MTRVARMRMLLLLLAALSPYGPAWSQAPSPAAGQAPNEALAPLATTQAPILLTGRVLLENGSPPPSPAKIELVCNSIAHSEGFTDTQGNFGIQFGGSAAAVSQDADEHDRLSPSVAEPTQLAPSASSVEAGASTASDKKFLDCELRAVLTGYRSQSVPLKPLHLMENPDIGAIVIRPNGAQSDGAVVTVQSLAVPNQARRLFERAQAELRTGKTDLARLNLEKAVAMYAEFAEAWCELGKLQAASGGLDAARDSFERARHADPNLVDPYLQLATMALWNRKWQEVADLSAKALDLDPVDYPQLFLYAAMANYNLRKTETAARNIERARSLDSRHTFPEIEYMAGVIMAERKDYAAAAAHLRVYLQLAPDADDAGSARSRLAEAEKMTAAPAAR